MRILILNILILVFFTSEIVVAAVNKVKFSEEVESRKNTAVKLSLKDTILLAVRNHPNIEAAQLGYLSSKMALSLQEWNFYPHYSLQGVINNAGGREEGETIAHRTSVSVSPAVSLKTPIGTSITLNSINNTNPYFNPEISLEIVQPLLRGFGRAIVEAQLNNARDSEIIARLMVEKTLRTTIVNVVKAYLTLITAERIVAIDQQALSRAEKSVQQTKLFIKAGRKAGNELITVAANVASAQTTLENDKNNLEQARYSLLTAIGINPHTTIKFADINIENLIKAYHVPSLEKAKVEILKNDIQYQTDLITIEGTNKRNLLTAEDNTRWELELRATANVSGGWIGSDRPGFKNLLSGKNQGHTASLNLNIPLDDLNAKTQVAEAKIAIKRAQLALTQEKWNIETSAINTWQKVLSSKRALVFAADAEKLQQKTYQLNFQKYLHGLIDSLELQSAQFQLIQAQQSLLTAQISYLTALVDLDDLLGHTLTTWNIQVRL